MGEILFKLHNSYRQVVAICDKELYGRLIQEDNKQIDLTGDFFKGEEISKEDLKNEIEKCSAEDATFNVVGEKSISVFKEVGLVVDSGIIKINNVPVALVLL